MTFYTQLFTLFHIFSNKGSHRFKKKIYFAKKSFTKWVGGSSRFHTSIFFALNTCV